MGAMTYATIASRTAEEKAQQRAMSGLEAIETGSHERASVALTYLIVDNRPTLQ